LEMQMINCRNSRIKWMENNNKSLSIERLFF